MKKSILIFTGIIILSIIAVFLSVPPRNVDASEITSETKITVSDGQKPDVLTNKYTWGHLTLTGEDHIVLESTASGGIGSIYIQWEKIPGEWVLSAGTSNVTLGQKGFLHEYVDVTAYTGEPVDKVIINMPEAGAKICEIYVFSSGEVPSWVQKWEEPLEKADILLLSTHADDEHLFFAGILPYYSIERKADVQVVYFTNHWDTSSRPHEQLTGLWEMGVRAYPIVADMPDIYTETLSYSLSIYAQKGFDEETLVGFQVEMLRRFKPQVVIGHDPNGEYGHGVHMLNTHTLKQAVEISGDQTKYPESAEEYGVWSVPKFYLHLWNENKIVMDWDTPYASLGGKTPFEYSCEGFKCHESQSGTWFKTWMLGTEDSPITKASQIKTYSPCQFGLVRSLVGEDVAKNDFLENIVIYSQQPTPTPVPTPTLEPTLAPTPTSEVIATALPTQVTEQEPTAPASSGSQPPVVSTPVISADAQHGGGNSFVGSTLYNIIVGVVAAILVIFLIVLVSRKLGMGLKKIIFRICLCIVTFLLIIVIGAVGVLRTIHYGPSESFRNLFIASVMETSAAKFLAEWFWSEEEINAIIKPDMETDVEVTDPSVIVIPTESPDNPDDPGNPGNPDDPDNPQKPFDKNGLEIIDVYGRTFTGKMMIINDPTRVTIGTPSGGYGYNKEGTTTLDMVKNSNSIAGVNGGGFDDTSGSGNGGVPAGHWGTDGIVISGGKLLWGNLNQKYNVIGLTNEGILTLGSMTAKEALDMNITEALNFGPYLIMNGEPVSIGNVGESGLNPRTAIGQRADGAILLLVINGRQANSMGANYEDMIEVFMEFGAVNAANLDGGSSSYMVYEGEIITTCASLYGPRRMATSILVSRVEE